MTTRISNSFAFLAGIFFEGQFIMNSYSILLTMDVNTESIREQNIAMDRIKYFFNQILESSVFVQESETKMIEKYQHAGLKIVQLPDEPYDQVITLLLLYKLNAITEDKLIVSNIQLESNISDGIGFVYDLEDLPTNSPYKNGWWNENSVATRSYSAPVNKKEKIVKLVKKSDWSTIGLDWKEKECSKTEIIFAPESDK